MKIRIENDATPIGTKEKRKGMCRYNTGPHAQEVA